MRISRLFKIVYLLQEQEKMTARELAERLEVSTRTIMRDIDTLCEAGIPIYSTPGKGGGISILDHFILNKTILSREDQNRILFALQSLTLSGQMEEEELLTKLQTFFQNTQAGWLEVDFARWGHASNDQHKFSMIRDAILQHRVLSFSYSSMSGERTDRLVNPLRLIFKNHSWYLRGYCQEKKELRTFKTNRMTAVSNTEDYFTEEYVEMPPLESSMEYYGQLIPMILEFSPETGYRAYDYFCDGEITRNENGTVTVKTSIIMDPGICEFILSLGLGVRIIEPVEVQHQLLSVLDGIKDMYKTQNE